MGRKAAALWGFLAILLAAALLVLAAATLGSRGKAAAAVNAGDYSCKDCNVIIMLSDALRYDHLGCYGYEKNTSPNIDALCGRSLVFDNAIVQGTWTKPSLASLFTSRYADEHNVTASRDFSVGGLTALPESALTLAEILQGRGYRTKAMFGPNMPDESFFGFGQGFEEYFATHLSEEARTTNEGIKWMDDHNNESVFLYLHYYSTHTPYTIPAEYAKRFGATGNTSVDFATAEPYQFMNRTLSDGEVREIRAYYDGAVALFDEQVGKVLDYLERSGKSRNTILVVMADHGESLGEVFGTDPESREGTMADLIRKNFQVENSDPANMRVFGHLYVFNKIIQIPLIIHAPAMRGGSRYAGMVEEIDIAPTLLKTAGIDVPARFEGKDLFDMADGKGGRDYAFSEVLWADGNKTVAIRSERFLFAESTKSLQPRLYDLPVDPYRRHDVSELYPSEILVFQQKMDSYLDRAPLRAVTEAPLQSDVARALKIRGYIR